MKIKLTEDDSGISVWYYEILCDPNGRLILTDLLDLNEIVIEDENISIVFNYPFSTELGDLLIEDVWYNSDSRTVEIVIGS